MLFSGWSGHDSSYAIVNDTGKPVLHVELERWIREKEVTGDSVKMSVEQNPDLLKDVTHVAIIPPTRNVTQHSSFDLISNHKITVVGHHQAHAANAFFSSNFGSALIFTIDGGGIEEDGLETAFTVWEGVDNKISVIDRIPSNIVNIGGLWTRATRYIFKLQSGWPRGHAAGTVMAMASIEDGSKYVDDFYRMLTTDLLPASTRPAGQPAGAVVPENDPIHPYLNKWRLIGEKSERDLFELASGLQTATEKLVKELLTKYVRSDTRYLCFAGGVALNSVIMGKVKTWFPQIEDIYVTPTPHDGGLTLGAAQYVCHQVLGTPRVTWNNHLMPYLGLQPQFSEIKGTLDRHSDKIVVTSTNDDAVIELLDQQKIVAVYYGRSESGRRALGHRSILADPRSPTMKDIINEKVKHRQWFRPFAPSFLAEEISKWFETTADSPYMSFVLKFTEEARTKVPAIVHIDGTARLQTVTANDEPWYHAFITKWFKKTGIPTLLNTSFNDCEPICETAEHSMQCFLRTEIDHLYFPEHGLLVSRK